MKKEFRAIKVDFMDEELNAIAIIMKLMKFMSVAQMKRIISYVAHRQIGAPISWNGEEAR